MKLYNKVIEVEPYFSASAHYYKAFLLGRSKKFKKDSDKKFSVEFRNELMEAAKLFDAYSNAEMRSAAIVGKINQVKVRNADSDKSDKSNEKKKESNRISSYEKQKNRFLEIYNSFISSIDDMLGHTITPQTFNSAVDDDEALADFIFRDLLRVGVLKHPRVNKEFF